MSGFALLWGRILDSSIWQENEATRLVWITMLAMKDKDGVVQAAPVGLAARARVSLDACLAALKKFKEPDPLSSNPENEGKRIEEIPGGWLILNADFYQCSNDAKRAFWREQKAKQRARQKERERLLGMKKGLPLPGESAALRREAAGDVNGAERIAEEALPVEKSIVPPAVQGMPAVVGLDVEEPEPPGIPIPEIRPGVAVAAVKVERPYSA
jgi:hypothetical protein